MKANLEELIPQLVTRVETLLKRPMNFDAAVKMVLDSETMRGYEFSEQELAEIDKAVHRQLHVDLMETAKLSAQSKNPVMRVSGRIPRRSTPEQRREAVIDFKKLQANDHDGD